MSNPVQGVVVLGAPDHTRPWLVSGTGRSGTTGLVRFLDGLGVRNVTTGTVNHENKDLLAAWQAGDLEAIRAFRRLQWPPGTAVKLPGLASAAQADPELAAALDCNYLISIRDAVAESFYDQRQHPDANAGDLALQRAVMTESLIHAAIELSQAHGSILVSYEKLIQPMASWDIARELCRLVGGDAERLEDAVRALTPQDAEYRTASDEDFDRLTGGASAG